MLLNIDKELFMYSEKQYYLIVIIFVLEHLSKYCFGLNVKCFPVWMHVNLTSFFFCFFFQFVILHSEEITSFLT